MAQQAPKSNLPEFFNKLAYIYPRQTGNSTKDLFSHIVDRVDPITTQTVLHDNAAGPATATSVLFEKRPTETRQAQKIIITDMVQAMVEASEEIIGTQGWREGLAGTIEAQVMNSNTLTFPDEFFTHSITNMSVFNFLEPLVALQSIHRTLKSGGQAVVTTWKRFAPGVIVHEVQRRVRPDLPPMRTSGSELYKGEAVLALMEQAGFDRNKMELEAARVIVTGEDLEGLVDFLRGPFTNSARRDWTDEEKGRWQQVLDEVMKEETQAENGVAVESWVVIARK